MTDYISRADAIEAVVNMQDGSGQTYEFVREAMFALKALPSADRPSKVIATVKVDTDEVIERIKEEFEEVVRCKDCKHRDLFSCPLTDNDFQKDEDFCSWGERRKL